MKKIALFALCVAFVDAAFALHNSGKALGWSAGWSWDAGRSGRLAGMNDDDLIDWLYTKGSSSTDHPSLQQRLEYRKTYEVTEDIDEGDYGHQGRSPPQYQDYSQDYDYNRVSSLENSRDYAPFPDNSIGPDSSHPQSSSSSMYMTSGNGDSVHTVYSHKIIHNKK